MRMRRGIRRLRTKINRRYGHCRHGEHDRGYSADTHSHRNLLSRKRRADTRPPRQKFDVRQRLDQERGEGDVRRWTEIDVRWRRRLIESSRSKSGRVHVRKRTPRNDSRQRVDRINLGTCNGFVRSRVRLAAIARAAVRPARELAVLAAGHLRFGCRDRGLGTGRPYGPTEGHREDER